MAEILEIVDQNLVKKFFAGKSKAKYFRAIYTSSLINSSFSKCNLVYELFTFEQISNQSTTNDARILRCCTFKIVTKNAQHDFEWD